MSSYSRFSGIPTFILAMVLTATYVETFTLWRWLGTMLAPEQAEMVPFVLTGLVLVLAVGLGFVIKRRAIPVQWPLVILGVAIAIGSLFLSDPQFPAKRIHIVQYGVLVIVVRQAFSYRLGGVALLWASVIVTALLGCHEELMQGLHPLRTYGLDDAGRNMAAALAGGLIGHGLHLFERERPPGEGVSSALSLEGGAVLLGVLLLLFSLTAFRSDWIPWWTMVPLLVAGAVWCWRFGGWFGGALHPVSLGFWLCQTMMLYPLLANVSPLVLH